MGFPKTAHSVFKNSVSPGVALLGKTGHTDKIRRALNLQFNKLGSGLPSLICSGRYANFGPGLDRGVNDLSKHASCLVL